MTENHSSCFRVSDEINCKTCYSKNIIKNGTTKTKKQQYVCKNCGKRFLKFYTYRAYKKSINEKIILLTKEGLGVRSTARVLKISATTLLKRIIIIAKNIQPSAIVTNKEYEIDEMRLFIKSKNNLQWLIYAVDKTSKKVVSFHIGKRTNKTLKTVINTVLNSKPRRISTDKLRNYQYLIPKEIHSTKRFGTNIIERKNLSIRTHLKRLNRRTICFSKSSLVLNSILKIYFWDKTQTLIHEK